MKKKTAEIEAMESRLAEMTKRMEKLKERLTTVRGEVKSELERRIDAASAG
jgi:tetrahydromethanopterin S-methyltransferase subunit G